jgi:hypothetical protein
MGTGKWVLSLDCHQKNQAKTEMQNLSPVAVSFPRSGGELKRLNALKYFPVRSLLFAISLRSGPQFCQSCTDRATRDNI